MSSVLYDIIHIVTLPRGFVAPTKVLILSYPRLNFSSRSPMYCTKIYGTREGSGRKKRRDVFQIQRPASVHRTQIELFFFGLKEQEKRYLLIELN